MIIGTADITFTRSEALIGNLNIGGRNLIQSNNLFGMGEDVYDITNFLKTGEIIFKGQAVNDTGVCFTMPSAINDMVMGEEYTLAFSIKQVDGLLSNFEVVTDACFTIQTIKVNGIEAESPLITVGDATKREVVVTLARTAVVADEVTTGKVCIMVNQGLVDVGTVSILNLKLEKGNVSTGFSPAPEDVNSLFDLQADILAELQESTAPQTIIDTVLYSNDLTTILGDKANKEDIADMATGSQVTQLETNLTEYVDTAKALQDDSINKLTADLTKVKGQIDASFGLSGGINLIQNSVGYFGHDMWTVTGALETVSNLELEQLVVGSGFYSPNTSITKAVQEIPVKSDTDYTISFFMKKPQGAGNAFIKVYDANDKALYQFSTYSASDVSNQYKAFAYTFKTPNNAETIKIAIEIDSVVECYITALMLSEGTTNYGWTQHSTEIANTNIQMNINGIKVLGADGNSYTVMSPFEFSGYANVLNEDTNTINTERIFTLNGDTTEVNRLKAKRSIDLGNMVIVPIAKDAINGWAWFKK